MWFDGLGGANCDRILLRRFFRQDREECLGLGLALHVEIMAADDFLGIPSLQSCIAHRAKLRHMHRNICVPQHVMRKPELFGDAGALVPDVFDDEGVFSQWIGFEPCVKVRLDGDIALHIHLGNIWLNVDDSGFQIYVSSGQFGDFSIVVVGAHAGKEGESEERHKNTVTVVFHIVHEREGLFGSQRRRGAAFVGNPVVWDFRDGVFTDPTLVLRIFHEGRDYAPAVVVGLEFGIASCAPRRDALGGQVGHEHILEAPLEQGGLLADGQELGIGDKLTSMLDSALGNIFGDGLDKQLVRFGCLVVGKGEVYQLGECAAVAPDAQKDGFGLSQLFVGKVGAHHPQVGSGGLDGLEFKGIFFD